MKTELIAAGLAAAIGLPGLWFSKATDPESLAETVFIKADTIAYRPIGNFHRNGKSVVPPEQQRHVGAFEIMKYQVSGAEYAACVAASACKEADSAPAEASLPQTHVSWHDAAAYAEWYSKETGHSWRLPDEAEWQLAAAEIFGDEAVETDGGDPAQRWLRQYARGVTLRGLPGPAQGPKSEPGANSNGLTGLGGNIWEWTGGCMQNGEVRKDGSLELSDPYCSARITGGRHRAVVIDFIRDASVGGCAVGLPPDYLGFRLVKDG
ncbi:formylglycine-generating enzyme family protein [Leisingera aquaemixtae]|uniref:formylglycine-generating enzyme family protein n=1 Tax=Leisingera aquaemixtae TaxID=1396826 RepID=UPI0021A8BCDB|nr:formylglycine-generating enzyme family protein [Leisingera aquaemixtae]UWQ45695.1 formylglycine-generating enzyme family protein [Leisingera aquaemixtae]